MILQELLSKKLGVVCSVALKEESGQVESKIRDSRPKTLSIEDEKCMKVRKRKEQEKKSPDT